MSTNEVRDGAWKLYDYDPVYRRMVWVQHDRSTGETHFRIDYEVSGLLEQNREAYNTASNNWAGEYMHHIAAVPLNLYYDELAQREHDPKAFDRWLNDPEHRAFRTKKGWVG